MNLKRFTSFALAFILCFALAPVNADALASENDAVKNGYYDSSGQWVEGKLQQTLPEGIHSVPIKSFPFLVSNKGISITHISIPFSFVSILHCSCISR